MITNKAQDIARDIAGLTSILEYDLEPRPSVRIEDTYYDTKQELLRKKQMGLRTRRIGRNLFVSLKSNPSRLDGRGLRRIEIETPWSEASLRKIARALKAQAAIRTMSTFNASPAEVFAAMRLVVVQRRKTTRTVRNVIRHDKQIRKRIAEIDIDSVVFSGAPKIRVHEIEIEAKNSGSVQDIQRLANALKSDFAGFLMDWSFGKLATGMAIHRLLRSRELEKYVKHERLTSEAFPLIENDIQANR